jgi:hydrogenase nickel incorporation protein HypA/HybF
MHEYSIVQSLLDSCQTHAEENGAKKVTKVVVKIGVLSGVEPQLLKSAFDTFKDRTICQEALFEINVQPLVLECNECHERFQSKKFEFKCKKCGSLNVKSIDGEEMYLMSLELE